LDNYHIFKPVLDFTFIKDPFWDIKNSQNKAVESLVELNNAIPEPIKDSLKNHEGYLMSLPNYSAIPLALNKPQLHLAYLQLYANSPNNADGMNIEAVKSVYPNIKIIIHDKSVDKRIFLSENPLLLLSIYKNFQIETFEKKLLLLTPKNSSWENINCIKKNKDEEYNFTKIYLEKSFFEKIAATFYKGKEICLEFLDDSTNKTDYKRTYYSQLEKGIVTTPFSIKVNDVLSYLKDGEVKTLEKFNIRNCSDIINKHDSNSLEINREEYFLCN